MSWEGNGFRGNSRLTVAAMDRFLTTIKLGVMFFIPVGLFYQFMMSVGPTKADLEVY